MSTINALPLGNITYRVHINGVYNPFVLVDQLSGKLRDANAVTTVDIPLQYHAHRDPVNYPVNDGDNVKIYALYGDVRSLVWQGIIIEPKTSWQSDANGWKSTVVKHAADYRTVLNRVPFRTDRQYFHTWTCSDNAVNFSEQQPVVASDQGQDYDILTSGFSLRFNARQRFDEVVQRSEEDGGGYDQINDSNPLTGPGRWFAINRTAPEIIAYMWRRAAAELALALPAGVSIQLDPSYLNVGKYTDADGNDAWIVPEEFEITPGTSLLEALSTLLDKVGNWALDLNPSYRAEDGIEQEQPSLVFYALDDTTNVIDTWWAGPDANTAPQDHPYGVTSIDLAVRKKPIANRVIGILSAFHGSIASDALHDTALSASEQAGRTENVEGDSGLKHNLSVDYTTCIFYPADGSDVTGPPEAWQAERYWHRTGRIVAGFVKVCEWSIKPVWKTCQWMYLDDANEIAVKTTENPWLDDWDNSPYAKAGWIQSGKTHDQYDWPEDQTFPSHVLYAVLVKPNIRVEQLRLGPVRKNTWEDNTTQQYYHSAWLETPLYQKIDLLGHTIYVKTNIGQPHFNYEQRARKHRTDLSQQHPEQGDTTAVPFGIAPSVQTFVYDTLLPVNYRVNEDGAQLGAIPVLNPDAPDDPDSYCTESEIDKAPDPAAPWRTGDGTAGSGHVITARPFVEHSVNDLRLGTDGEPVTNSQARWDIAVAELKSMVISRFNELAKSTTDGAIEHLHDDLLLRGHIANTRHAPIATPLAWRINLRTGAPDGTHFTHWQTMRARIISISIAPRGKLALQLNDAPILPGFTSRRARNNNTGRP